MANKVVALFLMSIVVLAAAAHMAEATLTTEDMKAEVSGKDFYTACFLACHKDCHDAGHGNSRCEMKCDNQCTAEVHAAKLDGANGFKVHL